MDTWSFIFSDFIIAKTFFKATFGRHGEFQKRKKKLGKKGICREIHCNPSGKNSVQLEFWLEFSSSSSITNSLYRPQLHLTHQPWSEDWAGSIDCITKIRKTEQYVTCPKLSQCWTICNINLWSLPFRGKCSSSSNNQGELERWLSQTSSPGFCWHQDTCDAQTICRPSTHTRKIKSTGCSCREPGFRSQHPQCSSQWSVAPEFQGIHWPLLALWASGIHIMHIINTCRPNTHTHKININFKKKMNRLSFHTNGLITILKRALSVI